MSQGKGPKKNEEKRKTHKTDTSKSTTDAKPGPKAPTVGPIPEAGPTPDSPLDVFEDPFILHHPTRRQMVALVRMRPGINANQIRVALKINIRLVAVHLARLVEAGLVLRRPSAQGKEDLLFVPEHEALWKNPRTRILFGREYTRRVALYVADTPGSSAKQIAAAMHLAPVTVRYHLAKLKRAGLVGLVWVHPNATYHPAKDLQDWVRALGDRFTFERPWLEKRPTRLHRKRS